MRTCSIGRLFDAVSSLVGVRHRIDYEAELESLARAVRNPEPYRFALVSDPAEPGGDLVADPGPVLRAVVDDVRRGTVAAIVAARSHAGLATLVADLADHERERCGLDAVVLAGGVFQNSLLLSSSVRLLEERGLTVLRPRLLPPLDGGLPLGQILVGSQS